MAAPAMFFPPLTKGGKYHRSNPVTGTALCGVPVVVDQDGMRSIHVAPGAAAHQICCARCSRLP